jgi:MoxR-like ATPase
VTVEGQTRTLPEPFLVLATENPIEQEGTFPLPEAQLDRFFVRTSLGYPAVEEEVAIVLEQRSRHPLESLEPVLEARELASLRAATEDVYVDELVVRWLVELVRATRSLDGVALGASVRASVALEKVARAWALLDGRDYVSPDDVERLFVPVVGHRLVFDAFALDEELSREERLERVRAACLAAAPRPDVGR